MNGDERRGNLGERKQELRERGIGLCLVGVVGALPEAAAAAADIQLVRFLDESGRTAGRPCLEVIVVHRGVTSFVRRSRQLRPSGPAIADCELRIADLKSAPADR